MGTSVRASSVANGTGVGASVAAPAGTAAGDLVVAICAVNNVSGSIADANGATPFVSHLTFFVAGIVSVNIYSRRIQGGDPSTYNFGAFSTDVWAAAAITFQNPHPSVKFDVIPAAGTFASDISNTLTTFSAPSITTTTSNAIHVVVGNPDNGSTGGAGPAGYTADQSSNALPLILAHKTIANPGATGAQAFTWVGVNPVIAGSFAIKDIGTVASKLMMMGVG